MKKIVVANLKMNLILEEVDKYIDMIKDKVKDNIEVVICPSFPFLIKYNNCNFKLGAQNVFYEEKGSYTGEVSPMQLKSVGVEYVIVGHSERRIYFNENDDLIKRKVEAVLGMGMKPIICIGETKEDRLKNNTNNVIKEQLSNILDNIDFNLINNIIIAYEPIWSIGSGTTPSNNDITNTITAIKEMILDKYNTNIKVLYGGSINLINIKEISQLSIVDGVLVGGASIDPETFIKLINSI